MDINDDMIRRFFDQACDEAEARAVADWLKAHPHVADQYYKESDWCSETGEQLPAAGWDAMWKAVTDKIRRRYIITRVAYGLAICLCITAVYIGLSDHSGPVAEVQYAQMQQVTDSFVCSNDSDSSLQYTLDDGTLVRLQPHSLLRLSHRQWRTVREVLVEGEAVFHVAGEQGRPFIVYCDNLSVQALGTIFSVKKHHGDRDVKVRLYEGKVVVKPVARDGQLLPHFTRYLQPGQELVIPLNTYRPMQQYFLQGQKGTDLISNRKKNSTPDIRPTGWYEFTSQPLADVFTTLEILHGVHIHYNKSTLENLFFIGRFEPDESIEDVLGTIALLNNLSVTKRSDNNYYVKAKG